MIALLLPAFVLLLAIYVYKTWIVVKDEGYSPLTPPGPEAYPVIGSSHLFRGNVNHFVKMTELSEEYGDIYSITLGNTKCVVVSSIETIKSVLLQNGKFFSGRPDFMRFHKLFGDDRQNSLALCDWSNLQMKRRNISRRYCDPGKHSPNRRTTSDVAVLEMKELMATLKKRGNEAFKKGEDLDIKPILMTTALNMFSQYMCSTRFDPEDDAEFKSIVDIFDNIFWDINQGHPVDFFPWLSPIFRTHMKKLTNWSSTIRKFILTRIINTRELDLDDDDEEKDFTDTLLKALKYETVLTKEAILFTLEDFLGGSSALGNVITLLLGFMAKHPKIAAKVQNEIDEVINGQRPVTMFDDDSLPYTMATIKEAIRHCSSPIVPHVATESGNVNGYTIEKGTVILINNYKLNTSEEYWKNPTEFQPERFLNKTYIEVSNERRGSDYDSGVEIEIESEKYNETNYKFNPQPFTTTINKTTKKEVYTLKTNIQHFIPFSIGKRTCLGRNLLMDYAFSTFANIMQNFDISCKNPENIKMFTACIALPPKTYGLTVTPRKIRMTK